MNTQGIGLGLVISENIVKAFNGRIGVKSKYGRGTKFAFSIILGKDDDFVDNMLNEAVLKQPSNRSINASSHTGGSVMHVASLAKDENMFHASSEASNFLDLPDMPQEKSNYEQVGIPSSTL